VVDSIAAHPVASTVVWAMVEASTVVVAGLLEAATEVAAEATLAESTRSIQLNRAKSKRQAGPTLSLAQLCLSLSSRRLLVSVKAASAPLPDRRQRS